MEVWNALSRMPVGCNSVERQESKGYLSLMGNSFDDPSLEMPASINDAHDQPLT